LGFSTLTANISGTDRQNEHLKKLDTIQYNTILV